MSRRLFFSVYPGRMILLPCFSVFSYVHGICTANVPKCAKMCQIYRSKNLLKPRLYGHKKSGKSLKINFLPPRSGLLDSNQRPRAPQTCALPTALNPELRCKITHFGGNDQIFRPLFLLLALFFCFPWPKTDYFSHRGSF